MTIEQEVINYRRMLTSKVISGTLTDKEADELAEQYESDLLWELKITDDYYNNPDDGRMCHRSQWQYGNSANMKGNKMLRLIRTIATWYYRRKVRINKVELLQGNSAELEDS